VSRAILPAKQAGGYSTPSHNQELAEAFFNNQSLLYEKSGRYAICVAVEPF
jgi:hypothetical protein